MAFVHKVVGDSDIVKTFSLIQQLRPALAELTEDEYVTTIKRLQAHYGYQMVAVADDGTFASIAGYRITESLAWNKYLYIDDLITDQNKRSNGFAGLLFDFLLEEAKRNHCQQIHLDSGVHRHVAHRFYLNKRFDITCHHFQMNIEPDTTIEK